MNRFQDFYREKKKWIALAIDFSLTHEAMRRILKYISSPYKTWATIRRNLEKYSGLYTEKYLSCNGHMLLSEQPVDENSTSVEYQSLSQSPYIVCRERKTRLGLSSFEYIPLQPRLEKWFLDETTCKNLFEYQSLDHFNREPVSESDVFERYADFFDGSLYKSIVSKCGGRDAAR